MAIRAFTGLPGSGKTYRVVKELLMEKWTDSYYVVHNIDGLKSAAVSVSGCCKSVEEVREALELKPGVDFWTRSVQEKLVAAVRQRYPKKGVLVICDESQQVFGKRGMDQARLEWLTYHRHLGQEVWLVTQNVDLLSPDVRDLIEVELRAKRGVVTSMYLYQWRAGGHAYKMDRCKRLPAVYAAYQSAQIHTGGAARSKLPWIAAGLLVSAVGGMYAFADSYARPYRERQAALEAGKAGQRASDPSEANRPAFSPSSGPPGVLSSAAVSSVGSGPPPGRVVGPPSGVVSGGRARRAPPRVVSAPVSLPRQDSGEEVFKDERGRWAYAGTVNGRAMLYDGARLERLEDVVSLGEWRIMGADSSKRVLVLVHVTRGVLEWRSGSGCWLGVDG